MSTVQRPAVNVRFWPQPALTCRHAASGDEGRRISAACCLFAYPGRIDPQSGLLAGPACNMLADTSSSGFLGGHACRCRTGLQRDMFGRGGAMPGKVGIASECHVMQ
jgi:hypothetical protein